MSERRTCAVRECVCGAEDVDPNLKALNLSRDLRSTLPFFQLEQGRSS